MVRVAGASGTLAGVVLSAVLVYGGGGNVLTLDTISLDGFETGVVEVRVTNDEPVLGFSLAIAFDPAEIEVLSIDAMGAATGADLAVGQIFPPDGGAVLSVVLDTDAIGPASIPVSTDVVIAELIILPTQLPPSELISELIFSDDVFGDPPVANQLVMESSTIGAGDGLAMVDGAVTLVPGPPDVLNIENTPIPSLERDAVRILMSNPSGPVEGFGLAIQHDATELELEEIDIEGTITELVGAEFVLADTTPAGGPGGTLTVILDFDVPFGGQKIPPGADQHIANFVYRVLADLVQGVDLPEQYTVAFVDDVLGDPPGENFLLITGIPQAVSPVLEDGAVTAVPRPPEPISQVSFYIGGPDLELDDQGEPIADFPLGLRGETVEVCFFYTSEVNIQGFQLAVCYDCELKLSDFRIDDSIVEAVGAEFVNFQIDQNGFDGDGCELIVGILLDALPPFDGQTVPATEDPLRIGCVDATICDEPICAPQPSESSQGLAFYCGPSGGLELDAGGDPVDSFIRGVPGETVDVCFYYTSEFSEIQGFQLAVCFDCALEFGQFTIDGGIVDEVGAEFVNFNVDNDPDDGDGCELVAGILLDIFPPFEGQTVPATDVPLLIGCIDATISPDTPCESLLTVEFCDFVDASGDVPIQNIAVVDFESAQDVAKFCCAVLVGGPEPCVCLGLAFCNDIDGTGEIMIENIAVVDFESVQQIDTFPGEVCIDREIRFIRGDCNQDEKVDLADAAAVLGEQFFDLDVDCEDACDPNDDGHINLADSVYLLNYLLDFSAEPLLPFPDCGFDPTDDSLECESFAECL